MNAVRVFIATTEGPAEVQRITEEDPDVRSVVCLDGKAMPLPISPDYDAFVRNPTGVIERGFGHGAFRLDVSQRISDGMSWQLGVFLAHALKAEGRLAERQAKVAGVVWATGEVDRDLAVGAVDGIPEKLRSSAELFDRLRNGRLPVTLLLPKANADAIDRSLAAELGLGKEIKVVGVTQAEEACRALGLKPIGVKPAAARSRAVVTPPPVRHRRSFAGWVTAAVLLATVAAIAAAAAQWQPALEEWQRLQQAGKMIALNEALARTERRADCFTCTIVPRLYRRLYVSVRTVPLDGIEISAVESRETRFGECGRSGLTSGDAERKTEIKAAGGDFEDSSLRGLCWIQYRVRNGPEVLHIGLIAPAIHPPGAGDGAFTGTRQAAAGELVRLTLDLPRRAAPQLNEILIMVARWPLDDAITWTGGRLAKLGHPPEPGDWVRLRDELAQTGVGTLFIRHRLVP